MFSKILVANRGEIACRIVRTCRQLGIETVAVYSDADACARHVGDADHAYHIGPAAAAESYLRGERIIDVACAAGAEAVHPGYGFLSENADFADACDQAGLVFIGAPAAAIRAMGSKSAAKALMQRAGIDVTPGYHGDDQSLQRLSAEAAAIGYPVLLKATAGGGGKGMRAVLSANELAAAVAGSQREAQAAFGDDRLLLEKYLLNPRHIEVQVFADQHGNTVHLFERDCSIQRRHQKVVEEAPAPGLSVELRERLGATAVAAARAVDYLGAGTVEFIFADGQFYFMEMNTRLQVEHPVTEMITDLDLVEWQLRVANGEPLPIADQATLAERVRGHAIEVRLYAEDPKRGFLPASGTVQHLQTPADGINGVRLDSGIKAGDRIETHYDPMLAKLIAHGDNRDQARRRLCQALADWQLVGVSNNRDFLRRVLTHPAFAAGALDTGFIDAHAATLALDDAPDVLPDTVMVLAALAAQRRVEQLAATAAATSTDPWSPWWRGDGWQLNDECQSIIRFEQAGEPLTLIVSRRANGECLITINDRPVPLRVATIAHNDVTIAAELQQAQACRRLSANAVWHGRQLTLFQASASYTLTLVDPSAAGTAVSDGEDHLLAPMPGTVIQVLVETGEVVKKGQTLLVLEAMKMEHAINAPHDGLVEQLRYAVGDQVADGEELLTLSVADPA